MLALAGLVPAVAHAVDGNVVLENAKLAPPATVGSGEEFGAAITSLGNLNGTGGPDIAVGADRDDAAAGAVYVFFLDAEGVPLSSHKIPATAPLGGGRLGRALAYLGDMDGDGLPSLAIGAPDGSGGGLVSGVVWIAELESVDRRGGRRAAHRERSRTAFRPGCSTTTTSSATRSRTRATGTATAGPS